MTYALKIREYEIAARREGEKVGEFKDKVSAIRSGRGQGSDGFLMRILGVNQKLFDQISEMIDNNPDWTDEDIAYELLDENE